MSRSLHQIVEDARIVCDCIGCNPWQGQDKPRTSCVAASLVTFALNQPETMRLFRLVDNIVAAAYEGEVNDNMYNHIVKRVEHLRSLEK